MKKLILLITLALPFFCFSQTGSIKGNVKDESGKNMAGTIVRIQGSSIKTTADSSGNYVLKNVPYGKVLVIIGDEKTLNATENVDVNKPEVVVNIISKNDVNETIVSGTEDIPVISVESDGGGGENSDNSSGGGGSVGSVSSELNASRDAFTSATSYLFSSARYRVRGYSYNNFTTMMNGVYMTDLYFGGSLYNAWSGLNDVTRNRESSIGLKSTGYSFGAIGGVTNIDSRASRQRKQIQVSYASTNRTYKNRLVATYGSGVNPKGWAFSLSYVRRWADEGYVDGSFYDGHSFFASVEKIINTKHSISFSAFATKNKIGRVAAATQESYDLAGTHYYNPNWGYQNGEKRNAVVSDIFQPMGILSHDWKINNRSSLQTGLSYQQGKNKLSTLDWYNASDARPDYYRYLPSFDPAYGDVPAAAAMDSATLADYYTAHPEALQINWDKIYEANQLHDTAKYVLANRVTDAKRFSFNSIYNNNITDHLKFSAGITYQMQELEFYEEIADMLGGNYFVDLNDFADLTNPEDSAGLQNDLNNPNRKLHLGDRFAYDYIAHISRGGAWAQGLWQFDRFDYFIAAEFNTTSFYRTGKFRNGVFADDSYGDSPKHTFSEPGVKGGITYKYNGRNYLYANASYSEKAPLFRDAYVSPNTRNETANDLTTSKITSLEGGYLFKAPRFKGRATAFYTTINDQTSTLRFYHGDFKTFVNYALTGINTNHVGFELAADASLGKGFGATAVAAIGQYYYNSRPTANISQDNKDTLLAENETIYLKNLRVGGFPQNAYTAGISYRSPQYWYVYVNVSYFDNYYVSPNPARRTIGALDLVPENSDLWKTILSQEKRDGQFSVDVSGGWSWKINNGIKSLKRNSFLLLNLGVTNILNNKNINSNAYEQLRFDNDQHDINTFPNKYYYAYGATYFASLTLRFN